MYLLKKILSFLVILTIFLSPTDCIDNSDNSNNSYTGKWTKILDNIESIFKSQTDQLLAQLGSIKNDLNVSSECITSIERLLLRATKDEWALKMWDSMGRWPSGFVSGSFSSFGDYDQCLSIKDERNSFPISGKYCFLELRPPKPVHKINLNNTKYQNYYYESVINYWVKMDGFAPLANGICLPSVCTDNEIQQILAKTIISVNVVLIVIGTLLKYLNFSNESFAIRLLECYSFVNNNKILFKINTTKNREGQFKYIHGLRVISIFWILIGHIYALNLILFPMSEKVSPLSRLIDVRTMIRYLTTHFIANGGLAVETFFIISGFLAIYSILPVFKKNPINIFQFILLRWLRFSAPTVGMLCFIIIWPLFGSGPLFHPEFTDKITDPCYNSWWTNLLFINNWMNPPFMCNSITWYLSCDFQLYILLYFTVYFYYRRPVLSKLYIVLMVILSFTVPVLIVLAGISDAPNPATFFHLENKYPAEKIGIFVYATYNHLIPYFFGVILGLILIRKTQINIKPITRWILWIVLLPLTILIPFSSYGLVQTETIVDIPLQTAIMFGVIRVLWSSGVTWICYECATGRGGLINKLLSSNCLQPLSRLTFCIYLIHIVPIWYNFFTMRSPITSSQKDLVFIACADAVQSIFLSYLLYCTFEAPYVNICKLIFKPSINKHSHDDNNANRITIELTEPINESNM